MRRILSGMSGYKPKVAITIPKPCSESWEAMAGDARVRHCGGCDRDVRNVATMTPAEIDAMLAAPGPLPCMRIVQQQDGSLMTARVESQRGFLQHTSVVLSTVMLAATTSFAQKAHPAPSDNTATLQGLIVDPTGAPLPHATVELMSDGKRVTLAETNKDGVFTLNAAPGKFVIDAFAPGFTKSVAQRVDMVKGARKLENAIRLNVAVLMGDVVVVEKPLKTRKLEVQPTPPVSSTIPTN